MTEDNQDESVTNAINHLTEKVCNTLLDEFSALPDAMQLNVVLIKTAQLLLANIVCQVASTKDELEKIVDIQETEMRELIFNCALTGFSDKFQSHKH